MRIVFWFRRDLRLHDNAGLFEALYKADEVLPIFIFDPKILNKLEDKDDARVTFIHDALHKMQSTLVEHGSSLKVFHGKPEEIFETLIHDQKIDAVFTNKDYEPYAKQRDQSVKQILDKKDISFETFKDQVIFEGHEVLKDDGTPYTVFTPYSKKWKSKIEETTFHSFQSETLFHKFIQTSPESFPTLRDIGFIRSKLIFPESTVSEKLIRNYAETRDIPSIAGTSRLSVHFRFGTISIRQKAAKALRLNEKYFNELIWRDFYSSILQHFPTISESSFKPAYERIQWINNPEQFSAWCEGNTGYPLVDAGMRELKATGFMHNRIRMVVASFLTKHLLIDWRWGASWFARYLLDFDLASNQGGWQWAAGCGVDAAPYFRVFNPELQRQKFDPHNIYIKKWVPEWGTLAYPKPIVEHTMARDRCLRVYKEALNAQ
jgi:deoxyribodipyrimidine photo-lyase